MDASKDGAGGGIAILQDLREDVVLARGLAGLQPPDTAGKLQAILVRVISGPSKGLRGARQEDVSRRPEALVSEGTVVAKLSEEEALPSRGLLRRVRDADPEAVKEDRAAFGFQSTTRGTANHAPEASGGTTRQVARNVAEL